MKVYKLKTPYECLVKINNEEVELSPNETLEIEGKIYIYPIDNSDIVPFVIDTQSAKPCSHYDCIEERGIILLRESSICENYTISKLNISNEPCTFEIGGNKVTIIYKNFKKVIHLSERYNTYKTGHFNHIAYLHLKGQNHTLYAFNTKSGKMKKFSGKEIEITDKGFIVKNETENEYKVTAEGLSGTQTFTSTRPTCNETTPYHFLSALKYGDLEFAYSLLSPALQAKLPKTSLKDYFGIVSSFYSLSPFEYAVKSETLSLYTFEVKDKQITEIDNQQE